jgi:predicted Fe-S protein YdhL (DUF1289 family)
MTVYIIRRADGTLTAVGTPDNGNDDAVLRFMTADAGASIVGGGPVRVEDPGAYCATLRRERDEVRAWADTERAARIVAQDLRRRARRAVSRWRSIHAQHSANTQEGNHD